LQKFQSQEPKKREKNGDYFYGFSILDVSQLHFK